MWNPWIASVLATIVLITLFVIGFSFLIKKKTSMIETKNKIWSKINTKPKKIGAYVSISIIALILIVPIFRASTYILNFRYISEGYGDWRDSNGQKYLYVESSDPFDLGYIQGEELYKEIFNFRLILMGQYIGNYERMKLKAQEFLPFIPEDYEQEMRGMAVGASKASGWPITYLDIVLQNTYLDLYFGHEVPVSQDLEPMGCTAFGVKNDDGSIMLGQNFDFPRIMGPDVWNTLSYVHSNLTGKAEIFGLRVGAMLSIPSAKNSYGVYTLVNIIESNMTGDFMMPSTLRTRYALERARSADELFEMSFAGQNQSHSANMITADENKIIGIQILPAEVRTRNDTLIVNTNRYIYEDWNEKYFTKGDYSLSRQLNAEQLWEQAYQSGNHISHEELVGILGNNSTSAFGEGSEILRTTKDSRTSMTIAFFTKNGFGLGNVHDGLGALPF